MKMIFVRLERVFGKVFRILIVFFAIIVHLTILYHRYPKAPFLFFTPSRVESIQFGSLDRNSSTGVSFTQLDENAKAAMLKDLRSIVVTRPTSKYDFDFLKGPGVAVDMNLPFVITMKNGVSFRMTVSQNWDSGLCFLKVGPYEEPIKQEELLDPHHKQFRVALFPAAMSAAEDIDEFDSACSSIYTYQNYDDYDGQGYLYKHPESRVRDYFE